MVDSFFGEESDFIQSFIDELFLAPVDVPVVIFGLLVSSGLKSFWDAVGEIGLEFDIRTESF